MQGRVTGFLFALTSSTRMRHSPWDSARDLALHPWRWGVARGMDGTNQTWVWRTHRQEALQCVASVVV